MSMENMKYYELTYPQKSIWSMEQFYPNSNINRLGGYVRFFEKVDFDLLEKAFNAFVQKTEAMNIRISVIDDEPKQYVTESPYINLELIKINSTDFCAHLDEICKGHIEIINSPLYEFKMYEFEDGTGAFVAFLHHIISDAWTTNLFITQILDIYAKLTNRESIDDISFPKYTDFVKNEAEYLHSNKFLQDKEYWENEYSDAFDIVSLKKEPNSFLSQSRRITFEYSIEVLNKINNILKDNKISIPSFFMSLYSLYFSRLLGINNLVVGNPVLNRSNYAEKQTVGSFISTVPFRIEYNRDLSFEDYMVNTFKKQTSMYRHLKYPYSKILDFTRNKFNRFSNLYDIIFSYQVNKSQSKSIGIPYEITWVPNGVQSESIMIHMADANDTGNITVNYDYLTSVFSEKDIEMLHSRITSMINQIIENPNIFCKDIEIFSEDEGTLLLNTFNNTSSEYKKEAIIKVFEERVLSNPDNIAVTFEKESLTYKELNSAANSLAKEFQIKGVQPGDIIALLLSRSNNIIISILAILKAGATYLPIEPEYPKDRIDYMLSNSEAKLLVTDSVLVNSVSFNKATVLVDKFEFNYNDSSNLNLEYLPERLAYIMYTSGSTGRPKAVMIRNYSVVNFANSMKKRLDYSAESDNKVLSVTTVCFDIFVFEVFPTLLNGLHLVIANEEQQKSPSELSKLIIEENICKILTTPSRIQLLFMDDKYLGCLKVLKEIALGGEPFPQYLFENLPKLTNARILNLYGPTETTVYSTYKEISGSPEINVGKPIENTKIFILNSDKKLLPIGCIGEIYIGGDGVALGYYKNIELTSEKFIVNPYDNDSIIYNTGDLGKWTNDGELICLGRTDSQIKIRGYRIELGDIESHILKYPGIDKVVVTDKQGANGEKFLCAYFIAKEEINISELHKFLISYLPNYMIPSSFIKMESFPLTTNHKIDRKALPMPEEFYYDIGTYVAPSTETQKVLADILSKALNISRIGIKDDIFNYSADSLTIIRAQTLLIPYGFKIKTQDFYKLRTIELLANLIDNDTEVQPENASCQSDDNLDSINNYLENHFGIMDAIQKLEFNNILLAGSTGYLGVHILHSLIHNTKSTIYCPIRSKENMSGDARLKSLWEFYFNDERYPDDRIYVISCDLGSDNLGLNADKYNELGNDIDLVINCIAIVKYYGNYEDYNKVNVNILNQLVTFCKTFNIHLNHISTMGVSGNYMVSHSSLNNNFTEKNFYIGQNYDENVYIRSKFEAEKLLITNMINGLSASIYRVGNLTGRYSDGGFQKNITENAFYNILKFILIFKILPKDMLSQNIEFTPVDLCANFCTNLMHIQNPKNKIFHVYNNNYITVQDWLDFIKSYGVSVDVLSAEEFNNRIAELSKNMDALDTLRAIVNDLDSKKGLGFSQSVIPQNRVTNNYLKALGLEWPSITHEYINKILGYMTKSNYIPNDIIEHPHK